MSTRVSSGSYAALFKVPAIGISATITQAGLGTPTQFGEPVGTKPFPRRTVWLASIEYQFAFKSHDIANRLNQLADGEIVADTDIKSVGTFVARLTVPAGSRECFEKFFVKRKRRAISSDRWSSGKRITVPNYHRLTLPAARGSRSHLRP